MDERVLSENSEKNVSRIDLVSALGQENVTKLLEGRQVLQNSTEDVKKLLTPLPGRETLFRII